MLLPFDEMIDGVTEAAPFAAELVERRAPGLRCAVKRRGGPRGRLAPRRLDEPVAPKPAEQWIDRPLARDHAVDVGERADVVDTIKKFSDQEDEGSRFAIFFFFFFFF